MPQSYKQIQKQIEALQQRADKLREKEVGGVIERIKVAIKHYGITAEQLSLSASGAVVGRSKKGSRARQSPKYSDGQGNVWVGRGPRPLWLREALSAGRSLEEFAAGSSTVHTKKAVRKGKKRSTGVMYRDQAGHSWTGMGPRPRWLKDALAAGSSLEELLAQS